jgi:hypothetical protein
MLSGDGSDALLVPSWIFLASDRAALRLVTRRMKNKRESESDEDGGSLKKAIKRANA